MVQITVEQAENGFMVTHVRGGATEVFYVAVTQDDCAAVVKSILRGSFPDEKKAAPKKAKRVQGAATPNTSGELRDSDA